MRNFTLYFSCLLLTVSGYALGKDDSNAMKKPTVDTKPYSQKISAHMEQALQFTEQKRIKELLEYFKKEEVRNDPQIQTLIGTFYHDGIIYEKNEAKAAEWWEYAALQGDALAQANLAKLYFQGRGKEDREKGNFWLNKSLAQNHPLALDLLGIQYYEGDGVPQNYNKAFELYKSSAEQGNFSGMFHLGIMYLEGNGTNKNEKEAFKWLKKAAEGGVNEARFDLGLMYFNGEGVKQDRGLGATYIELSARAGYDQAQFTIGNIYESIGQPEKAKEWFKKAADQGHKPAQEALKAMRKGKT